jgi:formate dehydrogenase major subunit
MEISRRYFLKATGAGMGSLVLLSSLEGDALPKSIPLKKEIIGETPTICCYCSVGCGAYVATKGNLVTNIEGDPDHPINRGALCSKGQAMLQVHNVNGDINPYRLTKPLYRAPGASEFEEITWEQAIARVAENVKQTRDRTLVTTEAGIPVNRTEAIASLGGAELDNEECYLLAKMNRALGAVYVEHSARI